MSLTTPVMPKRDPSFSGEGWFLYWKTSFGLWESKLRSRPRPGPIFVPIYWGFHSETGEHTDFGVARPEADVKRIVDLAKQLGEEVVFLFPLGPVPYVPNGGLPPLLARHPALSPWALSWACAANDESIYHLYSFFDPRVYKAYRAFAFSFAHYLRRHQCHSQVIGLRAGCLHQGQFVSYFEDHGQAYEQGLRRFLDMKREGRDLPNSTAEELVGMENRWREEYSSMIKNLYFESAREAMGSYWLGAKSVCFLGGRPHDLPMSASDFSDYSGRYFSQIHDCLQKGNVSSTLLLRPQVAEGVLDRAVNAQMSHSFVFEGLDPEISGEFDHGTLLPLDLVEIDVQGLTLKLLADCGLIAYLRKSIGPSFRLDTGQLPAQQVEALAEHTAEEKIFFMSGDRSLSSALKWVMSAHPVIIETSTLSAAALRRLEMFNLENKLHEQHLLVNDVKIRIWQLGHGQLILLSLPDILRLGELQKEKFWDQLFSSISSPSLTIEAPAEIFSFWQKRAPSGQELKFHEIRRICVYNPSSYKKHMKISIPKNFALAKILDPIQAQVQNHGANTEIDLSPQASVVIEYGKFD